MANCKNCLHFEACKSFADHDGFDLALWTDKHGLWCSGEHFKDRSRFVELPCKVGDTVWYILDCGDWVDLCQQPCKICSTDCSMYRTEYREDWQAIEYEVENLQEAFEVFMLYKKDFFATLEEAEAEIVKRRKDNG